MEMNEKIMVDDREIVEVFFIFDLYPHPLTIYDTYFLYNERLIG